MISRILFGLSRNWKAKAISLILATLFYINLQNSKILIKTVSIPVEYPKLTGNMFFTKPPEKTVQVRVEGLKDVVNYYSQFLKAVVDIEDIKLGVTEVPIRRIVGIQSGLKVTKLRRTIPIEVESRGSKVVLFEAMFEGQPPPNFEKLTQIISPSKVTLTGKPQDLEKINKIILPEINLNDKKEAFSKSFKMPELPKGITAIGAKDINVNVNIIPATYKTGEQTVSGIPINCNGLDPRLEAELSEDQVSIRYFSSKPFRSAQILIGIQASVPCNATYESLRSRDQPPQVSKIRLIKSKELKGIEILQVSPEKVDVRYKIKDISNDFNSDIDESN